MGGTIMMAITRSASGASAYSRSACPTFSSWDDAIAFSADERESSGRSWSAIIDELLRIRRLEDDWDGEGSEAPHPALVDGAITLAQYLRAKGNPPPDRVHASVNATIYLEWHTPLGYTEIEVVSPLEAELRSVRKGSTDTEVLYLTRQS